MVDATDPLDAGGNQNDEENPNRIDNPDVAYIFKKTRDDFPAKPYHDDGNPEMYTTENRKKREALRTSPIVVEAIQKFMGEFQKTGSRNN